MLHYYYLFAFIAVFILNVNVKAQSVSENDSVALVALYNSTNGENWVKSENWLTGNVDTWYGIVCEDNRVKAINLSGNNLVGSLPDAFYNLSALRYVYISFNQVSGVIKDKIRHLEMLEVFWASNNQIGGMLPEALGSVDSLKTLYLNDNGFSGKVPDSIGYLNKLENINLSYNEFSGQLPRSVGNLLNLKYLILNNNSFKDSVPDELTSLNRLKVLKIENNYFSYIPDLTTISGLSNHRLTSELTLSNNYLDFTDLYKIKDILGNEVNYYPQRTFPLTTVVNLHPGDSVFFDMPSLSYIDTADNRNRYRFILDSKEVRAASPNSSFIVPSATYANVGSYYCQVTHESFPGLVMTINKYRLLPPYGYSWVSLGLKVDGALQDTVDYQILALKKDTGVYSVIAVHDTMLNRRNEFLIKSGTYLVDLIPTGNDTVLMSKYHKNSVRWINNQESVFKSRKDYAFNVSMIPKIFAQGTGSLSGVISIEDTTGTDGQGSGVLPAENIKVMVYSASEDLWYNQQLTASDGSYIFTGLPDGEYMVYVDYPGYTQDEPWAYTISGTDSDVADVNYTIYQQGNVVLDIEKPEAPVFSAESIKVFPDHSGNVHLVLDNHSIKRGEITIYDLTGKPVFNEVRSLELHNIFHLQLSSGIFIMQVKSGNARLAKKFMVR